MENSIRTSEHDGKTIEKLSSLLSHKSQCTLLGESRIPPYFEMEMTLALGFESLMKALD